MFKKLIVAGLAFTLAAQAPVNAKDNLGGILAGVIGAVIVGARRKGKAGSGCPRSTKEKRRRVNNVEVEQCKRQDQGNQGGNHA